MLKKNLTIKIGGILAKDEHKILSLAEDIKELSTKYSFILIHGGGKEVSVLSRKFGIEPVFENGIRITSEEEMKYVDKVLSGKINKRLVRQFQKKGIDAVGLSGSDGKIFIGKSINSADNYPSHTGNIEQVNTHLLNILLKNNYLPVIASTSMDKTGLPLNINADSVAFAISGSLDTFGIIFISDIPGIIKEGKVLKKIDIPSALKEIKSGIISGGMIPKVESAIEALSNGIKQITIGEYKNKGSLIDLITGKSGTQIYQK